MRMILGFMSDAVLHWIVTRDRFSIRSDHRIEIRPEPFLVPPLGKEPSIDLNANAVVEFGQLHLGGRKVNRAEADEQCQCSEEHAAFYNTVCLKQAVKMKIAPPGIRVARIDLSAG